MQTEAFIKQVKENRHYVKTIVEVMLLTATQNMAQRCHRENLNIENVNPGNLKKKLQLVARHGPAISARFMDGSVLTRYTSKKIQNEILATLAAMVRDEVIEEVKSSKFFSILVDESKDICKNEQISIVLRFFSKNKIQECFLDLKRLMV